MLNKIFIMGRRPAIRSCIERPAPPVTSFLWRWIGIQVPRRQKKGTQFHRCGHGAAPLIRGQIFHQNRMAIVEEPLQIQDWKVKDNRRNAEVVIK